MRKKNIYVLGTGLSHDGSACLLKNGKICVAIEKERITRIKHDGGIDSQAIEYCLKSEGIQYEDLSLVVQNANFGNFKFGDHYYRGQKRSFVGEGDVPVVTISHHLAHAFYAIGTTPFEKTAILVIDGCGSLYDECIDQPEDRTFPQEIDESCRHLYAEKDSFYAYEKGRLVTVYKDFSQWGFGIKGYPMCPGTTKDSVGGLYAAAAQYCLGPGENTGKLMGLAPYGRAGFFKSKIFELSGDRLFVNYDWMDNFRNPSLTHENFLKNFQYYADIAYWVQKETEEILVKLFQSRRRMVKDTCLSYTGGVALNISANALIARNRIFDNFYVTPAAGDNGLAIGCAFYGWLEVLEGKKKKHIGSTFFGREYPNAEILQSISKFVIPDKESQRLFLDRMFASLKEGFYPLLKRGSNYSIQITISDYKMFNLKIHDEKIIVKSNNYKNSADCSVTTSMSNFISLLLDVNNLSKLQREGKIIIDGNVQLLFETISIDSLLERTKKSMNSDPVFKDVKFSIENNVFKVTAALLKEGKIGAWFQGGSEFGPRALGHRSILADPRRKDIRNFINKEVKFREDFRPFAPAVLKEDVHFFFDNCGESPYMLIVDELKEEWRNQLPGIVHVDGSCRIQTVTEDSNDDFYRLINDFKELTGLPMLLNTSLNCMGMPIVETPIQALSFFYESKIDFLVMKNILITK